ncbi:hypothetical protein FQA39_LY15045 [Lamprigera yunnana]|nr:hypothetical protein FQA39_LY15045 [Lamprigera yunnana]
MFINISPGIQLKVVYDDVAKSNYKYIGTYLITVPRFLVVCPNIIKIMLQTDFSYFSNRSFYCKENDPLSQNLFSIGGKKWRSVRSKLSTAFIATKLKAMHPILMQRGEDLRNIIREKSVSKELVDIKDIGMSYNINVIASYGFGKECNCFLSDTEFKRQGIKVFDFLSTYRTVKLVIVGFESSTSALTFCLYEISINLEIQEKLRKEIFLVSTKYDILNYEALLEIKYMDQFISETLRKYPPVTFISRICVKDYCIPNSNSVLPKGTPVDFYILGLHHNPNYYAEPEKSDPE